MSINHVSITGNLTRDPELKATTSGSSVLNLGIAVNDRRKNQQTGEWEDVPNFFDVTVFGARGEGLAKHLHKGSKVAIEGKLRYRSWEAQDGSKRSKVEIVADEVDFMEPRQSAQGGSYAPSAPAPAPMPAPQPSAPQTAAPAPVVTYASTMPPVPTQTPGVYDEDIPF